MRDFLIVVAIPFVAFTAAWGLGKLVCSDTYTPPGGLPIRIECDGRARLVVEDSGAVRCICPRGGTP